VKKGGIWKGGAGFPDLAQRGAKAQAPPNTLRDFSRAFPCGVPGSMPIDGQTVPQVRIPGQEQLFTYLMK